MGRRTRERERSGKARGKKPHESQVFKQPAEVVIKRTGTRRKGGANP